MAGPQRAAITAAAHYHPERVITNQDLEKFIDTSDEWIRSRTGIVERRRVAPGEATSDMSLKAIDILLKENGTKPEEIDLILVGTVTPDMLFPSTACILQSKLGAKNAWGFDLLAACSGFLYALSVGNEFVRSGKAKKALIVGADTMSSILNDKDRNTAVLFGDGAGAVLLEPVPESSDLGIIDTLAHVDGSGGCFLYMPAGGSRQPATKETVEKNMHFVHQEGKSVFKVAVSEMARCSEEILERNHIRPQDVDLFIAHQANIRIIESVQKKLKLPDEKVMITIDRYANTTAATLPTCLAEAYRTKRVKKGDLVLLSAFGAGFTWGSTLLRWSYD